MSFLDENDNGIIDADKAGKALWAADEYDSIPTEGGCTCRSIVVAVVVLLIGVVLFVEVVSFLS